MKLIVRSNGGMADTFEAPEWYWSFYDSYLSVWSIDRKKTYRYPYTTIYRVETIGP